MFFNSSTPIRENFKSLCNSVPGMTEDFLEKLLNLGLIYRVCMQIHVYK